MAEIKKIFNTHIREANIEHNGNSFLVVYGRHINGGFCAFPKYNVATELSGYDGDYSFNCKKLKLAFAKVSEIDNDTISELAISITNGIKNIPEIMPF